MSIFDSLGRWGAVRASRRLAQSVPWLGGAVALAALGSAVRRKGWFGGSIDTALNAVPFVGAAKAGYETLRGRDLIADRFRVR